jgi:hypothetical protein
VDNAPPVFTKSGLEGFNFVRGTVTIKPEAQDALGLASVAYRLGSAPPFASSTTAPFTVTWNTQDTPDGRYDVRAEASDRAGNVASAPTATVIVDNTPPAASLAQPEANQVVSGIVTIKGTATDANFAKYRLEFGEGATPLQWQSIGADSLQAIDNGTLGVWNTLALTAGAYTLRLTVTDQAGATLTESRVVSVVRLGDVIPDGKITVGDAILALQIAVGVQSGTP